MDPWQVRVVRGSARRRRLAAAYDRGRYRCASSSRCNDAAWVVGWRVGLAGVSVSVTHASWQKIARPVPRSPWSPPPLAPRLLRPPRPPLLPPDAPAGAGGSLAFSASVGRQQYLVRKAVLPGVVLAIGLKATSLGLSCLEQGEQVGALALGEQHGPGEQARVGELEVGSDLSHVPHAVAHEQQLVLGEPRPRRDKRAGLGRGSPRCRGQCRRRRRPPSA